MVEINENYNNETTLDEYYPIIKENIQKLAVAENELEGVVSVNKTAVSGLAEKVRSGEAIGDGVITADHISSSAYSTLTISDGNFSIGGRTINVQLQPSGTVSKIRGYDIEDKNAVHEIPAASIGTLGGIKLYAGGGKNISGLNISDDGTARVNTAKGIQRSGSNEVMIDPASEAEVTAGTEQYKPVTPKTLAAELERRVVDGWGDDISELTAKTNGRFVSFVEVGTAVDALQHYSTTPQRIGTWIDGTPIWRWAFKLTTESEISSGGSFDVGTPLIKGNSAWLTGGFVHFNVSGAKNCTVLPILDDEFVCVTSVPQSIPKNTDVYGWVDIAAPENEIIF